MPFFDWRDVEPPQVLELLKQVRQFFNTPECWVYFPFAVNASGKEVAPIDPLAIKWSLSGALDKFAHGLPHADFLVCAARDFLNDISGGQLFRGKLGYDDELILLDLGIEHLSKGHTDETHTS
jgi:hypothetical protein